jgi:polysaccharide biosynthesis protein PslH
MNILAIYPYSPFPENSGGRIRGHQVLKALADSHRVSFVALGGDADRRVREQWPLAAALSKLLIVDPDRAVTLGSAGARLRAVRPKPPWGLPFWMRRRDLPQLWNALAGLPLGDFDVIHARNLHMAPYALAIRALRPSVKVVLDLDDVASIVRLRALRASKQRWVSRWRAQTYLDFWRLRLFERVYLRSFDSVWVCSDEDDLLLARWIGRDRSFVVPNVMDAGPFDSFRSLPRPRPMVVFVANLLSAPNVEAARFLCGRIWPLIRRAVPDAELCLVGCEPPADLLALDGVHGIHVAGAVADVRPYLAQAAVAVAPLLVGGGTRLKVLEAFAAGIPVVATTIGAEGIRARHGRDILIADDPAGFAQGCVDLLRNPELRAQLSDSAYELVRCEYHPSALTARVLQCYASLMFGDAPLAEDGTRARSA